MALHSHPPLASAFSGSILHRQLAAAPPATATAVHIRLSGCGHAPKPSPSIDIDEEGWRERARGEKRAACLFFYVCFDELCGRAPPATSAAAHIRLSGCGHAPKPSPSIDIDGDGWWGRARGEKRAACLTFVVCLKNNVGQPHWPLRRQPISSFLDVGMLQNPPRLSILSRRGGGSEAGMRNELLACFLLSF